MEFLEVMRRWMWVFLRVEWESVRKGGGQDRIRALQEDEEAIEMPVYQDQVYRDPGYREQAYRDEPEEDPRDVRDEVGLGIHVAVTRGPG